MQARIANPLWHATAGKKCQPNVAHNSWRKTRDEKTDRDRKQTDKQTKKRETEETFGTVESRYVNAGWAGCPNLQDIAQTHRQTGTKKKPHKTKTDRTSEAMA